MSYLEYDTKHAQYGKVVILPQNVNQHAEGKFKTSRVVSGRQMQVEPVPCDS